MSSHKRYVVVGTGGRCRMFIDAIYQAPFSEHADLVGLCDISQTRMDFWNRHITGELGGENLPTYHADDFDKMIAELKPDVVIVTTVDSLHHNYIIRAMELGCDVVSEKPMTTDEVKAKAIFDAIERTGQNLRVTFNYRYQTAISKMREIIASGAIGTPTHVDFQWYLDTSHGADYFRRWHREMDKSGGLLVHKSTHHFDLVNFLIDDYADTVFAMGDLKFYGKENAEARGEKYSYQRYTGNVTKEQDPFALDLTADERSKGLYFDAEKDSGYIRDRNVFGDAPPVDIYDTHAVLVRYRNGVVLNYSMYAYCPWEGERITVNGTKGTLEYFSRGQGHVIRGQSDDELADEQYAGEKYMRLQKMFQPPESIEIPPAKGGHGGGDAKILERIFLPDLPPDPLKRDATHIDGAASILVGVAGNRSIATGQPVRLDDLLPLPPKASGAQASDVASLAGTAK
ncbi:Gfo/Idh/MocA family protein [Phycisphaerales bacterium AB-hyl4]|uniref:Gfo/Idh/MocA family protein n=1 Tax=Natronomicrosphaera hydrolytica TaxID=3242702 RepID=A0ABV4U519_9BACT